MGFEDWPDARDKMYQESFEKKFALKYLLGVQTQIHIKKVVAL